MRLSAELSLYPLAGNVEQPVLDFIDDLVARVKCPPSPMP